MFNFFTKEKINGNKKIIENLVLFLILFIIVIVVINSLGENNTVSAKVNNVQEKIIEVNEEKDMDKKLEEILSLIDGAGKVNVLITYSNSVEEIPMYDTKQKTTSIEELDTSGGKRKTEEINNEQNIIFNENGNIKTPVIKQTINPKIVGVIVVADGAGNIKVKEELIKAVEALLDVSVHRIQVFARKK